jgi:hypothetical protein
MTLDFNWTTVAVVLLNVLVGGLLVAIVKRKPALDKLANDREANLLSERAKEMEDMRERISKLESIQERKDKAHADQIKQLETEQAAKDRLHEAERRADRHRINNLNGAFQALLLLLKKGVPVEDAVAEIETMRNEQLAREAVESATIRAAAIKAGLAEE